MLLSLLLAFSAMAAAPAVATPDFQWKLVELFSNERCDLVREATPKELYEKLRPNVRAILAFCEPKDADHEKLFASAEKEDPTGDLIFVLHAKYVWKRNREKARPLWENVLKHARNPSLRSMAERYLTDQVEKDEILHLSANSYQVKLKAGGGYETNPLFYLAPQSAQKHPQALSSLGLTGGFQRWLSFGSISANYDASYRRYLATPYLSAFNNQLETPLSLRLGTYEDLVLRPFYGFSLAGSKAYSTRFGLGVMGVAYRPDYKQSVQGSVFSERLYPLLVKPEEGTHFRFDYDWEFFPSDWIYKFRARMEHVRAINDFNNGTDIRYTHTDVGAQIGLTYLSRGIAYEGELRATMRLDSLASNYKSTTDGSKQSKRRNDLALVARPNVRIPLGGGLGLVVAYEFDRTFSPVGHTGDYADYNIQDQKGELLLVTEFSNY